MKGIIATFLAILLFSLSTTLYLFISTTYDYQSVDSFLSEQSGQNMIDNPYSLTDLEKVDFFGYLKSSKKLINESNPRLFGFSEFQHEWGQDEKNPKVVFTNNRALFCIYESALADYQGQTYKTYDPLAIPQYRDVNCVINRELIDYFYLSLKHLYDIVNRFQDALNANNPVELMKIKIQYLFDLKKIHDNCFLYFYRYLPDDDTNTYYNAEDACKTVLSRQFHESNQVMQFNDMIYVKENKYLRND